MLKYIFKRLLEMVPVVFFVVTLAFLWFDWRREALLAEREMSRKMF